MTRRLCMDLLLLPILIIPTPTLDTTPEWGWHGGPDSHSGQHGWAGRERETSEVAIVQVVERELVIDPAAVPELETSEVETAQVAEVGTSARETGQVAAVRERDPVAVVLRTKSVTAALRCGLLAVL